MQDFMRLYSTLVERCFNACAQDFTSKALTNNEVSVVPRSARQSESRRGEKGRRLLLRRGRVRSIADPSQTACVQNCTDKFLKHSERVGTRFAEHNAGEYAGQR